MEFILISILIACVWALVAARSYFSKLKRRKNSSLKSRSASTTVARVHRRSTEPKPRRSDAIVSPTVCPSDVIRGGAYVVDGDTIKIKRKQIRLFGVDAPEMNHPFGKKAKWALVSLCKGQEIRAEIVDTDDHDRLVAKCFLPDGRDLSAEMVKLGLAIDWAKYSGGIYRGMEVQGVRKKLWLADARQKGRMYIWEQYEKRKIRTGESATAASDEIKSKNTTA
ncbi:thermonuclease family protein [Shimia sp. R11_0]|nr:thermonuclease family protein [Shimia sp. R11_0]MBO9477992.1 thermonuclease family protein [Shimia sp. R11_0]